MDEGTVVAQRYRLGKRIGEGGMGAVYEAKHVMTGRRFAVKVLERRDHWPPEAIERFVREAQAPAEIQHPNLVDVFDAGTEPDGTPYLVMELLEGETLSDLLRRDRVVQAAQLAPLFDALLSALEAMHTRGFVHRDLKPANVFLAREPAQSATGSNPGVGNGAAGPRLKLLDLGIAKALGDGGSTRSGYVVGTPAYMAPEQMRSAKTATPRSDLWSVGVMLYECIAGHRPFRGETFSLLAQISGPRPSPSLAELAPELPHALTSLVDTLLQKEPARRPTSAASVRDLLSAALAQCPRFVPLAPLVSSDEPAPEAEAPAQDPRGYSPTEPVGTDPGAIVTHAGARKSRRVVMTLAGALAVVAVGLLATRKPGAPTHRANPSARPSASADLVRSHPEVGPFLDQWIGSLTATQGRGPMGNFYADRVKFRGGDGLATPANIGRYWAQLFRTDGSFVVDLARSTVTERPADLNAGVPAACINVEGAQGRVYEVRAMATEVVTDRSPEIGCPRLEGVYLLRMRRIAAGLRICHETWSMREGVCASCPTAPVCQPHSSAGPGA